MKSKVAKFFAWFLAITYVSVTILIGIIQYSEIKEMKKIQQNIKSDVSSIKYDVISIKYDVSSIKISVYY